MALFFWIIRMMALFTSFGCQQPHALSLLGKEILHSSGRVCALEVRLRELSSKGGVLFIDGDNVRGKTKFVVSKEKLCDDIISKLCDEQDFTGRVCVFFDHGARHEAFYLADSGLAVVFSGPRKSADDVISRDVRWIQQNLNQDVTVVTEDLLLRRRCRSSSMSSRGGKKWLKAQRAATTAGGGVGSGVFQSYLTEAGDTVIAKELNIITSPLFIEYIYGPNLARSLAYHDAKNDNVSVGELLCSDRETAPCPSVTEISVRELKAIKPLLRSTYARKKLKTNRYSQHHRFEVATRVGEPEDRGGIATVSLNNKIGIDDLSSLMRKEVSFRCQIDNILFKMQDGKIKRKPLSNKSNRGKNKKNSLRLSKAMTKQNKVALQKKLEVMQQRLDGVLAEAAMLNSQLKNKRQGSSPPLFASKSTYPQPLLEAETLISATPCVSSGSSVHRKHVDKIVAKAIGASALTLEEEDEELHQQGHRRWGLMYQAADDDDVIIRGSEIIRRMLEELDGDTSTGTATIAATAENAVTTVSAIGVESSVDSSRVADCVPLQEESVQSQPQSQSQSHVQPVQQIQRASKRVGEETWERVILAERMRRALAMRGAYSHLRSHAQQPHEKQQTQHGQEPSKLQELEGPPGLLSHPEGAGRDAEFSKALGTGTGTRTGTRGSIVQLQQSSNLLAAYVDYINAEWRRGTVL